MHIVAGRLACFDVVFPCQVGMFGGKECMRQVFVVCGRCEVRLPSFRLQCVRGTAGLCVCCGLKCLGTHRGWSIGVF